MAATFTPVTVTGTWMPTPGATPQGTVRFQLTTPISDGTSVIANRQLVEALVIRGVLCDPVTRTPGVMLYAVNDPATQPQGAAYKVDVTIEGQAQPSINIVLNASDAPTIDLAVKQPATLTNPVYSGQGPPGRIGNTGPPAPTVVAINYFVTNAHTLALTDAGCEVEVETVLPGAAVTVPLHATVAFPVGTVIGIRQVDTVQLQIVGAAGVTLRTPNGFHTAAQWSTVQLLQRAVDDWILSGDVA